MSKTLTKAQQNYNQIKKEDLALITAVERFRKFIYGHFILQINHHPLLALFNTSNRKRLDSCTANRLKHWVLRLIGFDFEIEYIRTENFEQADSLSKLIQEARQDFPDPDLEEVVASFQEEKTVLLQVLQESTQFLFQVTFQQLQQAIVKD